MCIHCNLFMLNFDFGLYFLEIKVFLFVSLALPRYLGQRLFRLINPRGVPRGQKAAMAAIK